jgi:subtilisin family serine protease
MQPRSFRYILPAGVTAALVIFGLVNWRGAAPADSSAVQVPLARAAELSRAPAQPSGSTAAASFAASSAAIDLASLPLSGELTRFPDAALVDAAELSRSGSRVEVARVFRVQNTAFPLIRFEETWNLSADGTPAMVRQVAMLADHAAIEVASSASDSAVKAALAKVGVEVARKTSSSPVWQVKLPSSDALAVPRLMAALADVALGMFIIEPDFLSFPQVLQTLPIDYSARRQWGHDMVELPAAWYKTVGDRRVVVAVVDSGIYVDHPDLKPNLWVNPSETRNGADSDGNGFVDDVNGWDFIMQSGRLVDRNGHGTHVAGIIGAVANNDPENAGSLGMVGASWNVQLLSLRVGDRSLPQTLINQAIDYASMMRRDYNIPIVATNNSYGGTGMSGINRSAIERSRDAGIVFVAAAGNSSVNANFTPVYPANYRVENMISVASSDETDNRSPFSNFGDGIVDIAAPGSEIYSTYIPGEPEEPEEGEEPVEPPPPYDYLSGTSMAAPYVAGAIALLKSAEPTLTWQELRSRILSSADRVPAFEGVVTEARRLNVRRALGAEPTPIARVLSPVSMNLQMPPEGRLVLDLKVSTRSGEPFQGPVVWSAVEIVPEGEEPQGQATFENADAPRTAVWFSQPGHYRVSLQAGEGALASKVDRHIYVGMPNPQAPRAISVTLSTEGDLSLGGRSRLVSQLNQQPDPFATYSYYWTVDGPAAPQLGDSTKASTPAFFTAQGDYTAWLQASDGNAAMLFALPVQIGPQAGSLANVFFGQIDGGGSFVLALRAGSSSGAFLASGPGLANARLGTFVVQGNGSFSFITAGGQQVMGMVAGSSVTGSIGAASFSGDAVSGSDQGISGIYHGMTSSSLDGMVHAVVAPNRDIFLSISDGAWELSGSGSVDANGNLEFTAGGATFSGHINALRGDGRGLYSSPAAQGQFYLAREGRPSRERLANISSRGAIGGTNGTMIAGFVVGGEPAQTMIRAVGPSLLQFNVPDAALEPTVELVRSSDSAKLGSNVSWGQSQAAQIISFSQSVGAFPLVQASRDAALVRELAPGAYTALIKSNGTVGGISLAEVYSAPTFEGEGARLVNLSTRGHVGSGDRALIGGFVVEGVLPLKVLVRAVGPSLAQFGVENPLQNLVLELWSNGSKMATSTVWGSEPNAQKIKATAVQVGAFALNDNSRDAALLMNLEPGVYTAVIRGAAGNFGTALVEVYAVP